jgi:tetratricopeptide (TPR) repeat protein
LAQQKYRQLLQDFPGTDGSAMERAGVLVERGKAQLALGNAEEARATFQTARNLAPDTTRPLIAEANLLLSEQNFAAAEPLFNRVLELDPKSNDARLGKAHLSRMTGNSGEALSRLDELVPDSKYAAARLARAEILIAQDKDNAAKSVLMPCWRSTAQHCGNYLDAVLATKARD